MQELLFVYGNMKRSFRNHFVLKHDRFIGKAITCKNYNMYPANNFMCAYMLENENIHPIKGELYELTHSIIEATNIDDGGLGYDYYKKEIEVQCEDKVYKAYAYFRLIKTPNKNENLPPCIDEWTEELANKGHFLAFY